MNSKKTKIFLIFLIILFFCLLCSLLALQYYLKSNNAEKDINVSFETPKPKTIEDIIKKYGAEYIRQEDNKIYVKFNTDLYDEQGKSNETFFVDIVNELAQFFETDTFYLIDEEANIEIKAVFDFEIEKYKIIINNIENFYENTDAKSYALVENSEIVKLSGLFVSNGYLERLIDNQMYLSSIKKYLDEGKELESGYTSYNDNTIRIKLVPNKAVLNIIFSDTYGYSILTDVEAGTPLSKVYELHDDNTFGSLDQKYLGYRTNDFYYFFYDDEVSVYGYSYARNAVFEELLEDYLNDGDLDKFVTTLSKKMLTYDTFDYDADIKKATMIFPTIGIEIKITDNNPKGIKLYSNYYFTEKTKAMVKNGLISYSTEDLVEKYEKVRREANT